MKINVDADFYVNVNYCYLCFSCLDIYSNLYDGMNFNLNFVVFSG